MGGFSFWTEATGEVSRCHFSGNASDSGGRSVCNTAGLTVRHCRMEANLGQTGAGLSFWHLTGGGAGGKTASSSRNHAQRRCDRIARDFSAGRIGRRGCLFAGKRLRRTQAARSLMWDQANAMQLLNCTCVQNTAGRGGGMFLDDAPLQALEVLNSVVHGNVRSDGVAEQIVGGSPTVQYCLVQGGYPGPSIDGDPQFVDAMHGDFRLLPGSPCIDSGYALYVPPDFATDAEGGQPACSTATATRWP